MSAAVTACLAGQPPQRLQRGPGGSLPRDVQHGDPVVRQRGQLLVGPVLPGLPGRSAASALPWPRPCAAPRRRQLSLGMDPAARRARSSRPASRPARVTSAVVCCLEGAGGPGLAGQAGERGLDFRDAAGDPVGLILAFALLPPAAVISLCSWTALSRTDSTIGHWSCTLLVDAQAAPFLQEILAPARLRHRRRGRFAAPPWPARPSSN